MSLTQAQITRLTALTALLPTGQVNIDSVLDSFDSIANLSTDGVSAFRRSGQSVMTPVPDVVNETAISDALLECSPQKVLAHQIVLAGIMQGE